MAREGLHDITISAFEAMTSAEIILRLNEAGIGNVDIEGACIDKNQIVLPPSTGSRTPVRKAASSETR